jgi:hypothetical protein
MEGKPIDIDYFGFRSSSYAVLMVCNPLTLNLEL